MLGEDEATVQKYLQANPRSCQTALDKNHSAASSFGASAMSGCCLDVMVASQDCHIALNTLDTKQMIALNRARGVDVQIPASKGEIFLGF
jgi:hypothetical protein